MIKTNSTRRSPCEHDKVYSGGLSNLAPRRWVFICRRCGDLGSDAVVDVSLVHADEFHAQRVAHGWSAPSEIPKAPRLPTQIKARDPSLAYAGMVTFAVLFLCCVMAAASGGCPVGVAMIAAGVSCLMFSLCLLRWMAR